jgi:hypothetical protein
VIVLAFRRDDSRRKKLIGELYAAPWIERPFWVAEQLEIALFKGLRGRLTARSGEARKKKTIPTRYLGQTSQEVHSSVQDTYVILNLANMKKDQALGAAAQKTAARNL